MNNSYVGKLQLILPDNLPDEWEVVNNPEEVLLGVQNGTIASLLRGIAKEQNWESLYDVLEKHPAQWLFDLSSFIPNEEEFIEPKIEFLKRAGSTHAKICFAVEADEWPWGKHTYKKIPRAVGYIRELILEA